MIQNGNKYLITTDNWFHGPDGQSYRAAWGTCVVKNINDVFGFNPQRPSTNWYLEVGEEGKEIIIAGCQIHYAIRCEERPIDDFESQYYEEKDTGLKLKSSRIYFANK